MRKKGFAIVGNAIKKYAITQDGGILYDLIEDRALAVDILALLQSGVGPEWDAIERALEGKAL